MPMRILLRPLALACSAAPLSVVLFCAAQAPVNPAPATVSSASPPAPAAQTAPSQVLQPALDGLQQALTALRTDKWKGGTVRTEATTNINAIQRDLKETLPPLLKDADVTPLTLSRMLPVARNINALYDVLLRVVDGARIAAPVDQVNQLQQIMVTVEKARSAWDDRLADTAAVQEKQVVTLQTTLQAQAANKCPAVAAPATPACPTPAPAHKAAVRKKPKPSATTTPAATAKPSS